MRKTWIAMVLCCIILLSGCANIYDNSYSAVRPHVKSSTTVGTQSLSASTRQELLTGIQKLIGSAKEEGVIYVDNYDQQQVQSDMQQLCATVKETYCVAAYALESISFELGKSDGRPALSLAIRYVRSRADILGIQAAADMSQAANQICRAMDRCDVSLVLKVNAYQEQDLLQVVENYAMENPHLVMEIPQVSWEVYPKEGTERVLELFFTYQTGRDALKSMQEKVNPVFASAVMYVSGDAGEHEKFSQLYSFLMERYDYKFDTSITPTYSLLRHGVGDSRAFAVVYAAMCRQAGLECIVVSGTKDGESHYWNIIHRDEKYFHVDLLAGSYRECKDEQMAGYVWDYSAYPACNGRTVPHE